MSRHKEQPGRMKKHQFSGWMAANTEPIPHDEKEPAGVEVAQKPVAWQWKADEGTEWLPCSKEWYDQVLSNSPGFVARALFTSPPGPSVQPPLIPRLLAAEAEVALLRKTVKRLEEGSWISVNEHMPNPGTTVLFGYRNTVGKWRTLRGHYSPLHTIDASAWEDGADDTKDGSFEPEGWWEDHVESETMNFVSDNVTHWKHLPAPPER